MKVKTIIKLRVNKNIILFSILVFGINIISAQKPPIKLNGTVKNDSINLQDINIKNLTSGLGTTSNKNGHFIIYAKKGDSILFSSIVFKNRIIKISDTHINSKTITIYLEPDFYQLKEVAINNSFKLDVSNLSFTPGTIYNKDDIYNRKPPNAESIADPNASFRGANPIAILFMAYNAITKKSRLKRKKRRLENKKSELLKNNFSNTIRNLYDDKFYIESLSIPKDKINLFLDYCQGNGLSEYYKESEFVIKDFLIKQAKKFNALKN